MFQSIYTTITRNVQKYVGKGSSWTMDSVIDHTVSISKRNPLAGSSYIKLPKELDLLLKYSLYKVNNMSEAEMKFNLGILFLGEHEKNSNRQVEFPGETEILGTLETYAKLKESDNGNEKSDPLAASGPLNEPCTVIWDTPVEDNGTLV